MYTSSFRNILDDIFHKIDTKPNFFIGIHIVWIMIMVLMRIQSMIRFPTVLFIIGSILGSYALDIAESIFSQKPSPFRTIVFLVLLCIVGLFVVTSTNNAFASGVILSLFLHIYILLLGAYRIEGTIAGWMYMTTFEIPAVIMKYIVLFIGMWFMILMFIAAF